MAPPGTRYFHSTFGYTLLSQAFESAARQPFLKYLDEQVIRRLKMMNTTADRPELVIPNRTRFYERSGGGQIVNAPYVDSSYKWAGGGFLSTAEDLVIFGSAHLREGFFKSGTLDLLFTAQRTAGRKETGVGLGWRIGVDTAKRRLLHHAGSINGGRAVILIYPETGVVVALLSNLSQTPSAVEKEAQTLAGPFVVLVEKGSANKYSCFHLRATRLALEKRRENGTNGNNGTNGALDCLVPSIPLFPPVPLSSFGITQPGRMHMQAAIRRE